MCYTNGYTAVAEGTEGKKPNGLLFVSFLSYLVHSFAVNRPKATRLLLPELIKYIVFA